MTPLQFARHVEQVAEQLAHDVDRFSWASEREDFAAVHAALDELAAAARQQVIDLERERDPLGEALNSGDGTYRP